MRRVAKTEHFKVIFGKPLRKGLVPHVTGVRRPRPRAQPYVFTHIYEDRNRSRQVRLKCEMLLDLWQSNWPDHFRNLLDDIKRYELETHNDAAASN